MLIKCVIKWPVRCRKPVLALSNTLLTDRTIQPRTVPGSTIRLYVPRCFSQMELCQHLVR